MQEMILTCTVSLKTLGINVPKKRVNIWGLKFSLLLFFHFFVTLSTEITNKDNYCKWSHH